MVIELLQSKSKDMSPSPKEGMAWKQQGILSQRDKSACWEDGSSDCNQQRSSYGTSGRHLKGHVGPGEQPWPRLRTEILMGGGMGQKTYKNLLTALGAEARFSRSVRAADISENCSRILQSPWSGTP